MKNFKLNNVIGGWLVFLISGIVYFLTTEPANSLWDCSEFIATSYKLEIGHPPGNPLFFLLARLFAMFAIDTQHVALAVNLMSCTASALTIAFLFWTISHLGRRMFAKENWVVLAAAFIGSMAYAFTDTFWFSAVESEVYALSSLFTAVVFWAILRWESVADEPHADRWLVLIAYLMGLSIGVHLLNLLAIPAIVFVYYFKKTSKVTKWGVVKATLISALLLAAVMFVIIPGTISLGAAFDMLFVNSFGLGVNTGLLTFALLLFALCGVGIYYTYKKGKTVINRILVFTTVVLLGYSCYALFPIRASANPPMNSNNPNNPFALKSLINRDQYGNRPLLMGPYFTSPAIDYIEKTSYAVVDGKYKPLTTISEVEYAPGYTYLFPRMYSSDQRHLQAYKNWSGMKGKKTVYNGETIVVPTFGENLKFFFSYQLNFMYWRYFLWNFVGRQSDIQTTGSITNGNWMSGITPIDELYLGPQSNLPSDMKNNPGRNLYYFLPLLLGLGGLFYQLKRDPKGFTVVMWLFFMTGIAIVMYLNSAPNEPRERDYAYSGSFYAFTIWLGLGVLAVYQLLEKYLKKEGVATIAASVVCLAVPTLLISQNWNDHDRSGRYVARDFGRNYLESTLPNSIIMNYGDNDTFPLWYSQEVEETRTDVRIMNMSYLGGDWYIDQMRIKANESAPVPFSLPREKYLGTNERLLVQDAFGRPLEIKQVMEVIKSNDPRTQLMMGNTVMDYVPAKTILIPVNKENVLASGIVKPEDAHLIVDTLVLNITKRDIDRSELMLLDLLANFDWKRPLYFTQTYSLDELGLRDYLQMDGFAYRLVPIKTVPDNPFAVGRIDSKLLYDNLMNRFKYGNVADKGVYADSFVQTTFSATQVRNTFARLAKQLIAEGDTVRAVQVLDRALAEMPFDKIYYSYGSTTPIIEAYYIAGETDRANELLIQWCNNLEEHIAYYSQFKGNKSDMIMQDISEKVTFMFELQKLANVFGQKEISDQIETYFKNTGIL